MADVLTFDELLSLAKPKPPLEYHVKAWDGRKVYVRDPSSADVDEWRMYCSRNRERTVPFAAKLVQILLCDAAGERLVPQTDDALRALAGSDAAAINEISVYCLSLVNEPGDEEMEEAEKN
jgi:hypothetical protein